MRSQIDGPLKELLKHSLEFSQNCVSEQKEGNKIIVDIMGKRKLLMGYLRGLVGFCKIYYGMFWGLWE